MSDWIEVKPRSISKQHHRYNEFPEAESPRSTLSRTSSFHEAGDIIGKVQIGKSAMREKKLEWSAIRRRDREKRIEKRNTQRESARETGKD